jgi:hypothetical protein
MAYASLSELRSYLFAGGTTAPATDDALLSAMIARAQASIDAALGGRSFEATIATKVYDLPDGEYLDVDDLLTVTTLTNGDGVVIPAGAYVLYPLNINPKRMIYLKATSGYTWLPDALGNDAGCISVAGTWGYMATPPDNIKQACIRLSTWMYRQKDTSADLDRPLMTGDGGIVLPSAMPRDVEQLLASYVRRYIA